MKPQIVALCCGLMAVPVTVWADTPMSYRRTFGPAVDPITRLAWGLGMVSLVVIVVIGVLLLSSLLRRRSAVDGDSSQLAVHRDGGGMAWIYVGSGISLIVLTGCMAWTLIVTAEVARPPSPPLLTVQVTASQWWWGLRYLSAQSDHIFTTANEIHIPVGQPIRFELASADVIHSFWIPQLAGKMDVIPGQTNVLWLQADKAGTYRGQCAAYCGVQHAHMAMLLVAESAQDFAAWQNHQLTEVPMAVSDSGRRGEELFQGHCAVCHTIRGTDAAGHVGPDLTHLMTRSTIAAGLMPNTPETLAGWIANPGSLKPGTHMPAQMLSGPELKAVTSYLNTLN